MLFGVHRNNPFATLDCVGFIFSLNLHSNNEGDIECEEINFWSRIKTRGTDNLCLNKTFCGVSKKKYLSNHHKLLQKQMAQIIQSI